MTSETLFQYDRIDESQRSVDSWYCNFICGFEAENKIEARVQFQSYCKKILK